MLCHDFSPQHLVALPFPPLHSEPHCSAGYRSLLWAAGGTVALPTRAGPGRYKDAAAAAAVATAVTRPLCPYLQ